MRYGPGFCLYEFPRGTPSTQFQLHVWLAVGYLAEAEACDKTVIFNDFPSRPLYASLATELVIIFVYRYTEQKWWTLSRCEKPLCQMRVMRVRFLATPAAAALE
jgi:predicted metal-binding membrane protein